jgi:arginine N-succinyltransferase
MVDIFEGGPIVSSSVGNIRTVKKSKKEVVTGISDRGSFPLDYIVSNTRLNFRACLGSITRAPGGGVVAPKAVSEALGVEPGDHVRFAPFKPSH